MIKIKGIEYKFTITLRAMMLFERITKKPFGINDMTDEYIYLYCLLMANNSDLDMTFEDLIDAMDEDPTIFQQFQNELSIYSNKMKLMMDDNNSSEDNKKKV